MCHGVCCGEADQKWKDVKVVSVVVVGMVVVPVSIACVVVWPMHACFLVLDPF